MRYNICGGVRVCNIVIKGGHKLSGSVKVQGAKNSVLPIIAATILSREESIIEGCPNLSDVQNSIKILEHLGCKVKKENDVLIIDPSGVSCTSVPRALMNQMRSSIIFLGAAIGRCRYAKMSSPGGCELGARPIDLHLKALKEMGVSIKTEGGVLEAFGENLKGSTICLDFPSVGATENIMLAASVADGVTVINNAAREPEIWDLQEFLVKMGAKISGAGTDTIVIEGVKELHGATHKVIPDRIVSATYLCAAMMCGGGIELKGADVSHFSAIEAVLRDMGGTFRNDGKNLYIKAPEKIKHIEMLRTMPYPGFPTDAQAPLTAALALSDGVSVLVENIFEDRFRHCYQLQKMGADIKCKGEVSIITGVKELYGAHVEAMELRGGAALVIAGAAAKGETVVSGIEYIERGYEDIVFDLKCLGADIEKIDRRG